MRNEKTRGIWVLGIAMALCVLPSEAKRTQAAQMLVIRVATLAPKASPFLRAFEELDQNIRQLSGGEVGFEVYSSGVAGDESDVIRKMKIGQLDAAMVTSDGLGLMVPEVNVLRAPGVISNYVQLEAVTRAVLPEFNELFEKNNYKLISWGEAGEYRYFSREPLRHPDDVKRMRPWLWPQSPVAQETWRTIGASPVPLGLPEVYGALSTKMIDLVESTSLAYVALQWHTTGLKHVTKQAHGMLMGAWVMNKSTFDKLSPAIQKEVVKLAQRNSEQENLRTRRSDQGALRRLIERGYTANAFTPEGEKAFEAAFASVRKRLTQRLYPAPLIGRVMELAQAARP